MIGRIGFYNELEPNRPDLTQGSIFDSIQKEAGPYELEIVRYLSSGVRVVDIMESTLDVVSGESHIKGGPSVLTDGSWIWRWDLPYYTARYHLRLPADFLSDVERNNFIANPPAADVISLIADYVKSDILKMSVAPIPPLQWPRPQSYSE